jgi:hypothetical protein
MTINWGALGVVAVVSLVVGRRSGARAAAPQVGIAMA